MNPLHALILVYLILPCSQSFFQSVAITRSCTKTALSPSISPSVVSAVSAAALLLLPFTPIPAHAAGYPASLQNQFVDPDGRFSFGYTKELTVSPKPLKTHDVEAYLKSDTTKGFSVGITVCDVLWHKNKLVAHLISSHLIYHLSTGGCVRVPAVSALK